MAIGAVCPTDIATLIPEVNGVIERDLDLVWSA
jgi:hypothetical protein